MQQEQKLRDDLGHFLQSVANAEGEQPEQPETVHVYFVREDAEKIEDEAVARTQSKPSKHLPLGALVAIFLNMLLFFSVLVSILPQLTTSVTITLIPVEKQVRTRATIPAVEGIPMSGQIHARVLPSFTLTQSQTVPATGHGHQNAQSAVGSITFFNGLFVSQAIAARTILTGADGVPVVTDQLVRIPAAQATTPPTYGQVTVSAHALNPGSRGNIPVRDMNTACCLPSVLAQNTASFQGGQNERDYSFVTKADIQRVGASLTTMLTRSENAAMQTQVTRQEGLITLPCPPIMSSDRQPGDEARTVTITVSEHCTGVAYDKAALQAQGRTLLTQEAAKTVGTHPILFGAIDITVLHATIMQNDKGIGALEVSISGTWVYQITQKEQQHIKYLIAGMLKEEAIQTLLALPGIQQVTISGIDPAAKLPETADLIRFVFVYSG